MNSIVLNSTVSQ